MKKFSCVLLTLILAALCCACSVEAADQRFSKDFFDLFDTVSTVTAYDTDEKAFDSHFDQFYKKLEEYHKLYDVYNSYDGIVNLNTLNAKAGEAPVEVDKRIIDLLEYGKEVYDLSSGKTNICFGAVLSIWSDYRQSGIDHPETAALPTMEELEAAAEHTDINDLVIDREKSTVYFADPKLRLDVGAIAKGYAVRETCAWARENLWSSAIISIGGNICTIGCKGNDGETPWIIGIENPDQTAANYLDIIKIINMSAVTSGNYQRYYTVNGKRYCHIIDTQTLMPAEYVSGVTVICADSALGDALSTTLFNMPIEQGLELVESLRGVEAVWADKDYNKIYSSGFGAYINN